jgi:hypothetical protein
MQAQKGEDLPLPIIPVEKSKYVACRQFVERIATVAKRKKLSRKEQLFELRHTRRRRSRLGTHGAEKRRRTHRVRLLAGPAEEGSGGASIRIAPPRLSMARRGPSRGATGKDHFDFDADDSHK